jgi:hypothetical protein
MRCPSGTIMLFTNRHKVKTPHLPQYSKSPFFLVKNLPILFFLNEVYALLAPALSTNCKQEKTLKASICITTNKRPWFACMYSMILQHGSKMQTVMF